MIQKKICMLGSFAVGKTSLVARFVHSMFSEQYHTTIGVKIDKKLVNLDGRDVSLILWDIHGDDEFQRVRSSYLRGASGYLLVADGTRRTTLDGALALRSSVAELLGDIPSLLLLNKVDLEEDWVIEPDDLENAIDEAQLIETSAKTGQGVEEAFLKLTRLILGEDLLRDNVRQADTEDKG